MPKHSLYSGSKGAIESGAARPLAVSGTRRSPSLPDTPTLVELGMNVQVTSWWGMLGPKGLPEPVTGQLNTEINAVLSRPDVIKVLNDQGIEPAPLSPAEFDALLRREFATWKDIVAEIGLRLD